MNMVSKSNTNQEFQTQKGSILFLQMSRLVFWNRFLRSNVLQKSKEQSGDRELMGCQLHVGFITNSTVCLSVSQILRHLFSHIKWEELFDFLLSRQYKKHKLTDLKEEFIPNQTLVSGATGLPSSYHDKLWNAYTSFLFLSAFSLSFPLTQFPITWTLCMNQVRV